MAAAFTHAHTLLHHSQDVVSDTGRIAVLPHYAATQTLLLQACVHRGQQLLPDLQARLSQLQYTRDTVKARCRHAGKASSIRPHTIFAGKCVCTISSTMLQPQHCMNRLVLCAGALTNLPAGVHLDMRLVPSCRWH